MAGLYIGNIHYLMKVVLGTVDKDETSGRESYLVDIIKTTYKDKALMEVSSQKKFAKRLWFDENMNTYTEKDAKKPWINWKTGQVFDDSIVIQ